MTPPPVPRGWCALLALGTTVVICLLAGGSSSAEPLLTSADVRLEKALDPGKFVYEIGARGRDFRFYLKARREPGGDDWVEPRQRLLPISTGGSVRMGHGLLHAGSLGGFGRELDSRSGSLFSLGEPRENPTLGEAPDVQGVAWMRSGGRSVSFGAAGRDRDDRARLVFGSRALDRSGRGVEWRVLAIEGGGWSGRGVLRTRGLVGALIGDVGSGNPRAVSIAFGDEGRRAALRATWRDAKGGGSSEVGLGLGVPGGSFAGSRIEASVEPHRSSARAPVSSVRFLLQRDGGTGRVAASIVARSLVADPGRVVATVRGMRATSSESSVGGSLSASSGRRAPDRIALQVASVWGATRISWDFTLWSRGGRSVSFAAMPRIRGRRSWSLSWTAESRHDRSPRLGVEIGWRALFSRTD